MDNNPIPYSNLFDIDGSNEALKRLISLLSDFLSAYKGGSDLFKEAIASQRLELERLINTTKQYKAESEKLNETNKEEVTQLAAIAAALQREAAAKRESLRITKELEEMQQNFAKESAEAAKAIDALKKKIEQLNSEVKKGKGGKGGKGGLPGVGEGAEETEKTLGGIKKRIDEINKAKLTAPISSLDALGKEAKELKDEFDNLNNVFKNGGKTADNLENTYKGLQIQTTQLTKELQSLENAFDLSTGAINRQNPRAVALQEQINRNNQALQNADTGLNKFQRNVGNYRSALADFGDNLTGGLVSSFKAGGAFAVGFELFSRLIGGITNGLKSFVELQARFESINNTIRFGSGTAQQAEKNFAFLKQTIDSLGLDIENTSEAFGTFAGAAIQSGVNAETVRATFLGVAQGATALGLGAEKSNRAFLALGQIVSKGRLQAEELRGQLGESLPGAFSIAARSLGVTEKELNKLLETGKVTADEFLPKFAAELQKTFGGASEEASNSLRANLNRINNGFKELFLNVGNQSEGFLSNIVSQISKALDAVNSFLEQTNAEKIEIQDKSIIKNLDEARSSQKLLTEYEKLTKDGVKPNSKERERLDQIVVALSDKLGKEVTELDKNTGALSVNTEKVKAAIKQRLLLANQDASSLALRANAIAEQNALSQSEINSLQKINNARKEGFKDQKINLGIVQQQYDENIRLLSSGTRENVNLTRSLAAAYSDLGLTPEQIESFKEYQKEVTAIGQKTQDVVKRTEEYTNIIDKLNQKGFSEADLNALFNPEIVAETTDSVGDLTAQVQKARQAFKDLYSDINFDAQQADIDVFRGVSDTATRQLQLEIDKLTAEYEAKIKDFKEKARAGGATTVQISVGIELLTGIRDSEIIKLKQKQDEIKKQFQELVSSMQFEARQSGIDLLKDGREKIAAQLQLDVDKITDEYRKKIEEFKREANETGIGIIEINAGVKLIEQTRDNEIQKVQKDQKENIQRNLDEISEKYAVFRENERTRDLETTEKTIKSEREKAARLRALQIRELQERIAVLTEGGAKLSEIEAAQNDLTEILNKKQNDPYEDLLRTANLYRDTLADIEGFLDEGTRKQLSKFTRLINLTTQLATAGARIAANGQTEGQAADLFKFLSALPKFETGGWTGNNAHLAIVGEKGRELILNNGIVTNPKTAPIVNALDKVQSTGNFSLLDAALKSANTPKLDMTSYMNAGTEKIILMQQATQPNIDPQQLAREIGKEVAKNVPRGEIVKIAGHFAAIETVGDNKRIEVQKNRNKLYPL